jgi:hypothetical protein
MYINRKPCSASLWDLGDFFHSKLHKYLGLSQFLNIHEEEFPCGEIEHLLQQVFGT